MSLTIVLASANPGKIREIRRGVDNGRIEIVPQSELGVVEIEETGLTFVENALIKARHAALASGRAAIADDSGLEVDALQGRPGVHSARYAGARASNEQNVARLLAELAGVDAAGRSARFQCVMVLLQHANDPTPIICQGTWNGAIAAEPRGDGGFGYDPVFVPDGMDRTASELTAAEKDALSHRGQALRQLLARLTELAAPTLS